MKELMHKIVPAVLVIFLFTGVSLAASDMATKKYDHAITEKKINFSWTIVDADIHISLSAPTTGWVGIGFNPSNRMKDANYILGYVKDGKVEITDDYGKGAVAHVSDTKAGGVVNVSHVSGVEESNITTISFVIPLNSGDAQDQVLDITGETKVLLAYGPDRDSFRTKHEEYSVLKVNLESGKYNSVPMK